jgi:type I restriction enzyme M protein
VPVYFDRRFHTQFELAMKLPKFEGFKSASIGNLIKSGVLTIRNGHGSPTQSIRVGAVPYIKVSDLRAGLLNINPTNRVPLAVAKRFWRGDQSGLEAWDLICPERTSKNIGDFCMLLPGQEDVVATKEVIVLRPGPAAAFDPFYLMWAMTLTVVRDQWKRVIFMQTNREDVGDRYLEIEIPIPPNRERADQVSAGFRDYYKKLAEARGSLRDYLAVNPDHHFFIGTAREVVGSDAVDEMDETDEMVEIPDPALDA